MKKTIVDGEAVLAYASASKTSNSKMFSNLRVLIYSYATQEIGYLSSMPTALDDPRIFDSCKNKVKCD